MRITSVIAVSLFVLSACEELGSDSNSASMPQSAPSVTVATPVTKKIIEDDEFGKILVEQSVNGMGADKTSTPDYNQLRTLDLHNPLLGIRTPVGLDPQQRAIAKPQGVN